MNEAQWGVESAHSQGMAARVGTLRLARTKSGRRRMRLFACACCRIAWPRLPDDRLREAVETAERFCDGLVTKEALGATHGVIRLLASNSGPFGRSPSAVRVAIDMAIAATHPQPHHAAFAMTATSAPLAGCLSEPKAEAWMCNMFRCIFGNPFQPVVAERSWQSPTVVRLTHGIYDTRNFADLPILGDALEEAGCSDAALLSHCRSDGPHARGCWAVDVALGNK